MRRALTRHPTTPCPAVETIEVEAARAAAGGLALHYRLRGALGDLVVPPPAAAPARTDGLWEHTCFEAFVSLGGDGYLEFNIAPSGQWAAYRFDGYRQGMTPLEIDPPRVEVARASRLDVRVDLALPPAGPVRLGLTAVIEAADGGLSYWALAHSPGPPDFHRAETRVLAL